MQLDVAQIAQVKGASLSAEGTVVLPDELGPGVAPKGPAEVHVTVTNTGRFLHAEGQVDLRLQVECVRCLESYEIELAIPFAEDYLSAGKAARVGSDEEFLLYSGDLLELDPAVATSVILALPMKPLCREDCPGLCPRCGHNLKWGPCACLAHADSASSPPEKEV